MAICAPSSPFDRAVFERGLERLAARYRPRFDESLFSRERYLAGDDTRRLGELQRALDSDARAIFCARGGYGAMRLLRALRLPPAEEAKILVGFSDITALHAALQSTGAISVHGPVVTQLGRLEEAEVEALFALLERPEYCPLLRGQGAAPGVVEGPVLGGNLSLVTRLVGTPYLPKLDGAILFLEEVGEPSYKLDRMWCHLELAGLFERVAGIALGEFTNCGEASEPEQMAQLLRSLATSTGRPCALGLPAGHGERNLPFPLGARARLDGEAGTLQFLEGAVRPRPAAE